MSFVNGTVKQELPSEVVVLSSDDEEHPIPGSTAPRIEPGTEDVKVKREPDTQSSSEDRKTAAIPPSPCLASAPSVQSKRVKRELESDGPPDRVISSPSGRNLSTTAPPQKSQRVERGFTSADGLVRPEAPTAEPRAASAPSSGGTEVHSVLSGSPHSGDIDLASQSRRRTTSELQNQAELLHGPSVDISVKYCFVERTWTLPVALVSHYSPFLKAACSDKPNGYKQAQIILNGSSTESFASFVEWMYHGSVPADPSMGQLTLTWLLGHRFQAPDFQDLVMEHIYHGLVDETAGKEDMSYFDIDLALNHAPRGSLLHELYLDFWATHCLSAARFIPVEDSFRFLLRHSEDARVCLVQAVIASPGKRVLKAKARYMITQGPNPE